ncbi:prepilin-type N-terminal cleavage/methylation domain-containing protein [Deinococcus sp. HMF7620]|uniref:Prepilin-type N-terminal cleavage/methylation domain-containing protein n=1 Tax=Deinococcus arboris TaxID=2682977 RepID=A0A7C9HPI5_9DEIO|nr:prepilin-type N-terminal cleavage/methylation domain-containing protein [Deinococcus arboris]MVN85389.1 prepilin-type N-terminal cleavage/methylation domain-containing protein [Deinococcus arboris]
MSSRNHGFTLIELLVAVALALIVLFAASNLLISSSSSATNLQARNDMAQEGQIALNYIAANVREAAYVYPNGTTLNLGGGDTTRRPGGGSWVVGNTNAPILAFIKAPKDVPPSDPCVHPVTGALDNEDACYKFVAYYPVLRSYWVNHISAESQNYPGADPANGDRWLLVEYRRNILANTLPTMANLGILNVASGSGKILLDYVQPAVPNLQPLFTVQADSPQTPGNVRVTMNFSMNRLASGKEVTIPARPSPDPATWTQTLSAAPRNIGTLAP